jgi:hypothetical protein
VKLAGLSDVLEAGRRVRDARVYNGFSWQERLAANPIQRPARYEPRGHNPVTCCVTGFSAPHDLKRSG